MKKYFILSALVAVVTLMSSCGGSKQVVDNDYYNNPVKNQKIDSNGDDGLVETKASPAEEYAELAPATRASGVFESGREYLATKGAATNAIGELSNRVTTAILAASEIFGIDFSKYAATDDEGQNVYDTETKATNFVSSISKNIISGASIVKKNRYYKSQNKLYRVFVCVEYNGDASQMAKKSVEELKQKVSDDYPWKSLTDLGAIN